jgi:hypothetical protein
LPLWQEANGDYFQYRAKVRQVCQKRLESLGIPVTIGIGGIDWNSEDEALIPIDDDDEIFRSVISIADKFTKGINIVVWNHFTDHLGKRKRNNTGCQLETCNWAIRKSFLAGIRERDRILSKHWHAGKLILGHMGLLKKEPVDLLARAKATLEPSFAKYHIKHPSVISLTEIHSVYYLHSGSISFLAAKMKREMPDPVAYIKKLPLHPLLENQCTP